ncbi:hypothetical protein NBCG_05070 [Nocardioidaceae bacterium Broad-1]|uniref:hypothetical protein n=1 Tax=Nocardioides luteus TaxID=1844 RepID=UPI00020283CF|nr:hypothetical protein [Nocardioides luteus]EGD40646.1 hypothetical protein NBCG_05070 [Nocardioidaceae bacterium Broad-1]
MWKIVGLAGLAGVTATGVIIARNHRQRTQRTPEEIHAKLRERIAAAQDAA